MIKISKKFHIITRIRPAQAKCKDDKPRDNTLNSKLGANKELSNNSAIWEHHLIDYLKQTFSAIYEKEVKWKRYFFMLLSVTESKDYTDGCT